MGMQTPAGCVVLALLMALSDPVVAAGATVNYGASRRRKKTHNDSARKRPHIESSKGGRNGRKTSEERQDKDKSVGANSSSGQRCMTEQNRCNISEFPSLLYHASLA